MTSLPGINDKPYWYQYDYDYDYWYKRNQREGITKTWSERCGDVGVGYEIWDVRDSSSRKAPLRIGYVLRLDTHYSSIPMFEGPSVIWEDGSLELLEYEQLDATEGPDGRVLVVFR